MIRYNNNNIINNLTIALVSRLQHNASVSPRDQSRPRTTDPEDSEALVYVSSEWGVAQGLDSPSMSFGDNPQDIFLGITLRIVNEENANTSHIDALEKTTPGDTLAGGGPINDSNSGVVFEPRRGGLGKLKIRSIRLDSAAILQGINPVKLRPSTDIPARVSHLLSIWSVVPRKMACMGLTPNEVQVRINSLGSLTVAIYIHMGSGQLTPGYQLDDSTSRWHENILTAQALYGTQGTCNVNETAGSGSK
ncbi:hypothetical protein LguiA_012872 [Lonicera macranthoides]